MTKKFEILPHTADVRLKVFGGTAEDLFKNALLGMAKILKKDSGKIGDSVKAKISIKSPDINALLVDFLSEVLYQSQINKVVYLDAIFLKFSDMELQAEIRGNKVDSFDEDIKAVTYHELEIKESLLVGGAGGFETIIVFDV